MANSLPDEGPIDITRRPFLADLGGASDPAAEGAPAAQGGLAGLFADATGANASGLHAVPPVTRAEGPVDPFLAMPASRLIHEVPGPPPAQTGDAPTAQQAAPTAYPAPHPAEPQAWAQQQWAPPQEQAPAPQAPAPQAPAQQPQIQVQPPTWPEYMPQALPQQQPEPAPQTQPINRPQAAAAPASDPLLTEDIDWDLVAQHVQALDLQNGIGRSRDTFDVATAGAAPETAEEQQAWQQISDLVDRHVNQLALQRGELFAWSAAKKAAHIQAVFDEAFRYGRLAPLLREDLESFNVYGAEKVVVTRPDGSKDELPPIARTDDELEKLVQRVVNDRGRSFAVPHGKIRIDIGGARFTALGGPSIVEHPLIAVRKHNHVDVDMAQLVSLGTLTPRMAAFLTASMRSYLSHLVSGWAYTGKTTFLRALTSSLPVDEPIVTIETERELYLHKLTHRHSEVIPLQYLPDANAGDDRSAAFSLEEAIEYANRANAQTFLFGEILGDREAAAAIKALQGGKGASSTIHAKSAYKAIQRLANLLTSAAGLSDDLVPQREIMESINLIVQLEVLRTPDGHRRRVVREIAEVVPGDAAAGRPQLPITKTLYVWDDARGAHVAQERPSEGLQRELLSSGSLRNDFFDEWAA